MTQLQLSFFYIVPRAGCLNIIKSFDFKHLDAVLGFKASYL